MLDATTEVDAQRVIDLLIKDMPAHSRNDIIIGFRIGTAVQGASSLFVILERREPTIEEMAEIVSIVKRRLSDFLDKTTRELNK